METIPFVKPEEAELARAIEKKLLALSPEAGIIFVGVDVSPSVAGQDPVYKVLVGLDRKLKLEGAVTQLATMTLAQELLSGADIQVEVRRGLPRG